MRGGIKHPIPLDFASILSMHHVPLLLDSPLAELAEALKHHDRAQLAGDRGFLRLVRSGLGITTAHLSKDCGELHAFRHDWDSGRYFTTGTAFRNLVSRTSMMLVEAQKYLEIASTMKRTRFAGSEEGLAGEPLTSAVAQSTLDVSTGVLKRLKDCSPLDV